MEKNTVTASCIKKYVKVGGKYNNQVYVLNPGDEWGHLYLCRSCGEIMYSYAAIKDVNQRPCPKCNAKTENNFLGYPNNIMLNGKLYRVEDIQIEARFDEPMEVVSFLKL